MDYTIKVDGEVKPIKDNVLVRDMEHGTRKSVGGIILLDDDGTTQGIHPRWAQVDCVGPDETTIKPGTWVLVDHGRWTRGVKVGDKVVRMVEKKSILLTCDDDPRLDTI